MKTFDVIFAGRFVDVIINAFQMLNEDSMSYITDMDRPATTRPVPRTPTKLEKINENEEIMKIIKMNLFW